MSNPKEHRASRSQGKRDREEQVLTWTTARRMLCLVRPIVRDILAGQRRLTVLMPEKSKLDRNRNQLNWPDRARRYQLQEEVTTEESKLEAAKTELAGLGVSVILADEGQIGFPTLVNDRKAYFSWRPDEESLQYWHFAGESIRRPIPASWIKQEACKS